MVAIDARDLFKSFTVKTKPEVTEGKPPSRRSVMRTITAVDHLTLEVPEGEFLALLGPNGAGKSTTIKMLSGILSPGGGSVRVLGLDPQKDRIALAHQVGTVFGQKSQLWYHLPASDSLELLASIYEIPRAEFRRRRDELVQRFSLADLLAVPVRKLSLGQRIRCEIAASLLHHPRLLFLDEPTIGLDVVVRQEIRQLLSELNKNEGVTIVLTSHDLGDVEKLCRRAVVINHGRIILDESVKTLKHQAMQRKIIGVKYAAPTDIQIRGLEPIKRGPDYARFDVDTSKFRLGEILSTLANLGELEDLSVEDEPLENIIADLYRQAAPKASQP